MITLQHSLLMLLHYDGNLNKFKQELPYVLLPDAIRAYSGPRQYSHFEQSRDGSDVSWMSFPLDVKHLTPESVREMDCHMAENVQSCCMGETTNIASFEEHNRHLSKDYFQGVKYHLIQDSQFDTFIREQIDCSQMYEDRFTYRGREMDGRAVRQTIADIEDDGVYLLAKQVYQKYGIVADQQWFDEHVKTTLDAAYPSDLSERTYRFMQMQTETNALIHQCDFNKVTMLSESEYQALYDNVLNEMKQADVMFEKRVTMPYEKAVAKFGDICVDTSETFQEYSK